MGSIPNPKHMLSVLCVKLPLGPLHTQDGEPVTNSLQALSLVEKAEPFQDHFTLRLTDQ